MATKKVMYNKKIELIFKDKINSENLIKKGSTSIIIQHPRYDSLVIVYTTDKSKVDWFRLMKNKVGFKFIDERIDGSTYDEVQKKIYKFQLKKLNELSSKNSEIVKKEILNKYNGIIGFQANMKFQKLGKFEKNKKLKYIFNCLEEFVTKNRVKTDLRLDSFMELPDGEIICTDPIYSTRDR